MKKITISLSLLATVYAVAQENDNTAIDSLSVPHSSTINQGDVLVTGTRSKGRAKIDTPVPVDVLDIKELTAAAPQVSINQILNYAAPSFSSNIQSIADGTDHIDPASLRGLGPDQVLVLINGKRRHTTSLLNVNGTIGRGSTGTDMNAIPSNAIERIEILRDGASAQYGSDAIAGVINIILKKNTGLWDVSLSSGANFTKNHGEDKDIDGETFNLGVNYGLKIGQKGYINFTGELEKRGWTDRNGDFTDAIFNGYNAVERVAQSNGVDLAALPNDINLIKQNALGVSYFSSDLQNSIASATSISQLQGLLKGDVTDNELKARNQTRSDYNVRFGQSALKGAKFAFNSSVPLNDKLEVYAFGGLSLRNGEATAFYRLPNAANTYTPLYLNGYQPLITSTITDHSLAAGIRGKIGQWDADLSNTFGKNSFDYTIKDTHNATLQKNSPTEFDAGGFAFTQNTTNLDIRRSFDWLSGFNLAFGSEFRYEQYALNAGEEASYERYDIYGNPVTLSTPSSDIVKDFLGNNRGNGSQGFTGIRATDDKAESRNSVAAYIDTELDVTKNWLISGALRFENYSDFGSTFNFKVASRYKITDDIAVRGAISSGFRAPSLHQIYFSQQNTFYDTATGKVQETGIYANDSDEAKSFGIPKLKEEKSISYSLGTTANIRPWNLKLTLDGYYIQIKDRVNLTESITAADITDANTLATFKSLGVDAVAFFGNTVNTENLGLDFIAEHRVNLGSKVSLTNTLSATFSKANVTDVHIPSSFTTAPAKYFSARSELILEEATPHVKGNLSHLLKYNNWSFFLRNSYFGKVKEISTRTNFVRTDGSIIDNEYDGRVITDLSIGYDFNKAINLTVGSNNIFDVYPEKADPEFTTSGRFPYSRNTQFGLGGRYLFAKISFKIK